MPQAGKSGCRHGSSRCPAAYQQPAGVAARAAGLDERLFRGLHAGLQAHQVADVALQLLVQRDQPVVRRRLLARDGREIRLERRRGRRLDHVRLEFERDLGLVGERTVLGRRFEEEIERIQHRHLGDQIDLDAKARGLVREHQARQVVRLRILLPVDEVRGGLDAHRVAQDARARMRRRTQPHDLRAELDRPVVAVVRDVIQRDVDGH